MNHKNLSISENCVSEELESELVILNLKTGKYYKLKTTGIYIWEIVCAEQITLEQLIVKAEKHFQGQSIRNDIVNFVKNLVDRDIFIES